MKTLFFFVLILGTFIPCAQTPAAHGADNPDGREIFIATVSGAIGPGVAAFIKDAVEQASKAKAAGLIIELDTPGGLAESMRTIVQTIFACTVPVIVYVTPSGARAASAGVMITLAADIAAMAPGANIGAAHPVGAGGQEISGSMADKVVNDMAAFTAGIAKRRGRNEQWAEKAVRESVSITAEDALEQNVIDIVARDLDDLIRQIDGRMVKDKGKLNLEKIKYARVKENLRSKILRAISDPNIAYILLMIGLAGLYFELSNPGALFPGVIGAIALILAFYSMQTLPVNTAGILLILLSVILFILELKVTSFGLLTIAGVVSLVLGSLMLFKDAGPQFQIAWQVLIPTVLCVAGFFMVVITLVVRAHARKPLSGAEALIGRIGVVKQVHGARGKVLVNGELWQAVFPDPVNDGDKIRVDAIEGLVLTVVAFKERPSQD